jgi:hypothetical protein
MVGVLIINTNLPVPSTWSRLGKAVATVPVAGGGYHVDSTDETSPFDLS